MGARHRAARGVWRRSSIRTRLGLPLRGLESLGRREREVRRRRRDPGTAGGRRDHRRGAEPAAPLRSLPASERAVRGDQSRRRPHLAGQVPRAGQGGVVSRRDARLDVRSPASAGLLPPRLQRIRERPAARGLEGAGALGGWQAVGGRPLDRGADLVDAGPRRLAQSSREPDLRDRVRRSVQGSLWSRVLQSAGLHGARGRRRHLHPGGRGGSRWPRLVRERAHDHIRRAARPRGLGRQVLPVLRSDAGRRNGGERRPRPARPSRRTAGAGGPEQRPGVLEPADRRAHLVARRRGPARRPRLSPQAGSHGGPADALCRDLRRSGGTGRMP